MAIAAEFAQALARDSQVRAPSQRRLFNAWEVDDLSLAVGKEVIVSGTIREVLQSRGERSAWLVLGPNSASSFAVQIADEDMLKFGGRRRLRGYYGKAILVSGKVARSGERLLIRPKDPEHLWEAE
jgi:hypothetical protein